MASCGELPCQCEALTESSRSCRIIGGLEESLYRFRYRCALNRLGPQIDRTVRLRHGRIDLTGERHKLRADLPLTFKCVLSFSPGLHSAAYLGMDL